MGIFLSRALFWRCFLHERDRIAFEEDPSDLLALLRLHIDFFGFVEHQVHVLVETDDAPLRRDARSHTGCRVLARTGSAHLDPHACLLVQPDLYPRAILQEAKNSG